MEYSYHSKVSVLSELFQLILLICSDYNNNKTTYKAKNKRNEKEK